jgi:hypothetical protein
MSAYQRFIRPYFSETTGSLCRTTDGPLKPSLGCEADDFFCTTAALDDHYDAAV